MFFLKLWHYVKRTGKEYKETEFGLRTERAKNKADNRGKRNIFYMIAIRRYIYQVLRQL